MTARIIRFDDHHPDFQGVRFDDPSINLEVYAFGMYLGTIRIKSDSEVYSYDNSSVCLGCFSSIERANAAVIASIGPSCQGTA